LAEFQILPPQKKARGTHGPSGGRSYVNFYAECVRVPRICDVFPSWPHVGLTNWRKQGFLVVLYMGAWAQKVERWDYPAKKSV